MRKLGFIYPKWGCIIFRLRGSDLTQETKGDLGHIKGCLTHTLAKPWHHRPSIHKGSSQGDFVVFSQNSKIRVMDPN